jgi:hypothetical protein
MNRFKIREDLQGGSSRGYLLRCALNNQPFMENKEAAALAQAIVDTVREPLLVLDRDLAKDI